MEEEQEIKTEVPKYRVIYSEMSTRSLEQIVTLASQSIQTFKMEKEACHHLIKKMSENRELENMGQINRSGTMAVFYWHVSFSFGFF